MLDLRLVPSDHSNLCVQDAVVHLGYVTLRQDWLEAVIFSLHIFVTRMVVHTSLCTADGNV